MANIALGEIFMSPLQMVDRVEIKVLVDNVTDSLSSTPNSVTREWSFLESRGMRLIGGGALCCANHGLSLLVTAYGGEKERTLLFDGGPVDYAVERNGIRMGVNFGAVEAIVLSHGHWDHAGGLPRALELISQGNGGAPVPLYLHPGMFELRGVRRPDGSVMPMAPVPLPQEWARLGAAPIVTTVEQLCLDNTFFISGEIPRITAYEVGFPGHVRQPSGSETWHADPLLVDERFLACHVRDKGLILFSACSHAGIVNVLRQATKVFPNVKIHAVIGGLHLSGPNEAIIPNTVRDMGAFNVDVFVPAHCTGWRAVNAMAREYGESGVMPCAVGKMYVF
jgi:7,8-dihydropterin-6-yl-methyl-4-(beta-D-ribofuranosyl)aminobenzene 5'-phosphate synthase